METAREVTTVLKWAQDAGKSTGIVTTARVTHATPGALYAHTAERDWECDMKEKEPPNRLPSKHDIAWQLVNTAPGNKTNVVMGGGHNSFVPEEQHMEERPVGNNILLIFFQLCLLKMIDSRKLYSRLKGFHTQDVIKILIIGIRGPRR